MDSGLGSGRDSRLRGRGGSAVIASFGSATTAAWCWPLPTAGLSDRFAREAAGSGALTEAARAIGLHYDSRAFRGAAGDAVGGSTRAMLPSPSRNA